MLLALALLASPRAESKIAACETFISATMPAAGDFDIPIDVQPLAIISGGDCAPPASFLVALLEDNEGGQPVVMDEEVEVSQPFTHLSLELPELSPIQDYIFRISPRDGGGETVEIPFSTGDRLTNDVSPGAPVFSVTSATRESAASGYRLSYAGVVTGEDDFERLSSTFVRDSEGEIVGAALLGQSFAANVTARWAVAEKPKELCLTATQVLANGVESAESAENCHDVVRGSGCATGGGRADLALGLLAALAALVRPRRRC